MKRKKFKEDTILKIFNREFFLCTKIINLLREVRTGRALAHSNVRPLP